MPQVDRLAYVGLALAMVASAALVLWFGRNFFFFGDEFTWFTSAPRDYDPSVLLRPHNTHLIALPRVIHVTALHLFGPSYFPWRAVGTAGVLVCAGFFFVLARRRVGALALLPTLVLLFLGTAWDVVLTPLGIPSLLAVAGGLGALLAVERRDLPGDLAACVMTTVGVASNLLGLVFTVGVAVSILLHEGRVRRAWVVAVPLALYVVWFLLAPKPPGQSPTTLASPSNLPLLPVWGGVALGAALATITGLNVDLVAQAPAGFNRLPSMNWILTPIPFLAGVALLVVRLRRGRPGPELWVFLATLAAFLLAVGVAYGPDRPPYATRYMFPGAVIVLLVIVETARGMRFSRRSVVALFALTVLSLTMNLIHVRDARRFLVADAVNARSTLAMIELAEGEVEPTFRPARHAPGASTRFLTVTAREYRSGVRKWGSIAAPLEEVRARPPVVRDRADMVLAKALRLALEPSSGAGSVERCETIEATGFGVPRGGALLRSPGGGEVRLRRFGESYSASVGALPAGGEAILRVPRDRAPEAWAASVPRASVEICDLPSA